MKQMFPRHARKIVINTTNMILDICTELHNKALLKSLWLLVVIELESLKQ